MNNASRTELERAVALIEEAQQIIEAVKDEEQEAFDNLGENFQTGERGQKDGRSYRRPGVGQRRMRRRAGQPRNGTRMNRPLGGRNDER